MEEEEIQKYSNLRSSQVIGMEQPKGYTPLDRMRRYIESLPPEISFKEELTNIKFWKSVRVEFLGSILYIVFGCGACMNFSSLPPVDQNSSIDFVEIKISLVFATLTALLMYLGCGSLTDYKGCHLNPSISFALFLVREITLLKFFTNFLVQFVASFLGSCILYGLTSFASSSSKPGLGVTIPMKQLSPSNIFGFEFFGTFLIVLTYLSVNDTRQQIETQISAFKHIYVGFAVLVSHLFAVSSNVSFLNAV
ncbi:Aquaporin-4-like protein [Dinothrombium tinctorium]|uniref:Aquaporin-4-like protein n=1 Tax=Dinothrombium tinctorium TaxID=1965070 RepID=A0A3S4QNW1_9ACAR|nr:Aquaporin-4-like protein [Dinothrombium tinctorium]RWS01981.1 Aquaporin-4-like protein [Dinothrombium tinctorium]RWS05889.1 Aquaporin-4-like protein [Dinothrombium tinctorium]RWS05943.1 Aquaporin-4-like protein [Dinothrombium tinctorium]